MDNCSLQSQEGFTIVEVLISIVLVTSILVPLMSLYLNLFATSDNISQRTKAVDLAENAADEFTYLYNENNPDLENKIEYWNDGKWKDDYVFSNNNSYKVRIKGQEEADYRLITIDVSWEKKTRRGNNKSYNVELETLIEDPDGNGGWLW